MDQHGYTQGDRVQDLQLREPTDYSTVSNSTMLSCIKPTQNRVDTKQAKIKALSSTMHDGQSTLKYQTVQTET